MENRVSAGEAVGHVVADVIGWTLCMAVVAGTLGSFAPGRPCRFAPDCYKMGPHGDSDF